MLHKRSHVISHRRRTPPYVFWVFLAKLDNHTYDPFFFLQRFLIGLTPSPHFQFSSDATVLLPIYSIKKSKTCKTHSINGNPKTYVMITSKTVNGRFTTLYPFTFMSGIFPSVIHTHLHWRMNWKLANINETIFPSQLFLIRDLWAVKRIRNPWPVDFGRWNETANSHLPI